MVAHAVIFRAGIVYWVGLVRMLFGYVSPKHSFEFSPEARRGGLGIRIVQPGEQHYAAIRADPGNLSFAVGADLANVV